MAHTKENLTREGVDSADKKKVMDLVHDYMDSFHIETEGYTYAEKILAFSSFAVLLRKEVKELGAGKYLSGFQALEELKGILKRDDVPEEAKIGLTKLYESTFGKIPC